MKLVGFRMITPFTFRAQVRLQLSQGLTVGSAYPASPDQFARLSTSGERQHVEGVPAAGAVSDTHPRARVRADPRIIRHSPSVTHPKSPAAASHVVNEL